MSDGISTRTACQLAGMDPATFRNAMMRERRRGRDYRVPSELWPDARTPLWDADAVSAWSQTRARRNSERKQP